MNKEYFKQVQVAEVTKEVSKKGNRMVVVKMWDGEKYLKHFIMVNDKYEEKRNKILERFNIESLNQLQGKYILAFVEEKEEGKYTNYNVKFMCKPKEPFVLDEKRDEFIFIDCDEELPF